MDTLLRDLRFALRTLSRARGFTAVVVLLLAIGIGASTAGFSVVDAVFLRPLPFRHPDRLMLVQGSASDRIEPVRPQDFHTIRDHATCFEDLAGVTNAWLTLVQGDTSELVGGAAVSVEYFRVFDGSPSLGRTFAPGDVEDDHLVVLSHALWQKAFGGDPGIVGALVNLNTQPYRVIGVMPADYLDEWWHELWVLSDLRSTGDRRVRWAQPVGRLRPHTDVAAARQEIATIGARLSEERPVNEEARSLGLLPYHEAIVRGSRHEVSMMAAAIVLVLLIACTNVANLFLARASARRAEIGLRLALGATPGRVVRQLLTEGVVLALAGGALGLILAARSAGVLVAGLARFVTHAERAGVDARALGFTACAALVTTLLFGLWPALQASRWSVRAALGAGARATASRRTHQIRSALVVSQIALAVVLVAGAGVLARSLARLASVDRGFDARGVAIFGLSLPAELYKTPERRASYFEAALAKLRTIPGVEAAGATSNLPTIGGSDDVLQIEGQAPFPPGSLEIRSNAVSPDYARAIGIRLRAGRFIDESDVLGSPPIIVINERMANRFFPGESPIGRRIHIDWGNEKKDVFYEIVGVTEDMRSESLLKPPMLETLVPLAQHPLSGAQFAVRVSVPPASVFPQLQRAFREVDLFVPIHQIQIGRTLNGTLEMFVTRDIQPLQFAAGLAAVLGAIALVLAVMGVFGVVSYWVEQRRHELAVRLALGAAPGDIFRLVLRRTALLVTAGVLAGLAAALLSLRLLGALVYGVSPLDPASLAIAAVVLAATALLASYLPARRATLISPMTALRGE